MRLRFTIRDLLWLPLVEAILLAWRFSHPVPAAGRYQLMPRPGFRPWLIDTATGHIWEQVSDSRWTDVPTPIEK
jgi:hypothetical protein